jgi:hypothetical protein
VILEAAQQVMDGVLLLLGEATEELGAVIEPVLSGILLVEAVAGGGVELDAQSLNDVVDRILDWPRLADLFDAHRSSSCATRDLWP